MNDLLLNRPILSVVIPVYCEGSHLRTVLATIQRTLDSVGKSYEFVLVDDGSLDDTWAVLEEVAERFPLFQAARLSRNFGKESALSAGLEMARGSAIIVIDGDLQHPPELIPEMVRLWSESDADVVEAVKHSRGRESLTNKIGARVFYALLNKLSGFDLTGTSDYKLLDRRVVNAWLEMGERNLFFRGMTAWLGFKRVRIPFGVAERTGGRSKWSTFKLIDTAISAVTAFSSALLQLTSCVGLAFFLFSLILGAQTFVRWITGKAVAGFTTVILVQLIIGSLVLISLGIVGLYIARIYDEVKGRPRYVIAQTIEKTQPS